MIMISQFDTPARRKATRLAILAVSASFAAIAAPAYAQCAEGPPDNYACSGTTDVPQVVVDDDVTVVADNSFTVDTSNNGNGLALSVTGNGLISYTGGDRYTGAGVRIATTGSSGSSAGEILAFSNADIFANGADGLYLGNSGGGDTTVSWLGTISNTGGDGVFATSAPGAGDLNLIVKDVIARDDGIAVTWGGNGAVFLTAVGPVIGQTGSGVHVSTGAAADDIEITVGDVTGGAYGIQVNNHGKGAVLVDASGTVTGQGLAGIYVSASSGTTGVDVRANVVKGQAHGIIVTNAGSGDTIVVATGAVSSVDPAATFGINVNNDVNARNLSITATDVTGAYGMAGTNDGTGSTRVVSTGDVTAFAGDGIIAKNGVNATDLFVDVKNVDASQAGIRTVNLGSGITVVRANGTVFAQASTGIRVEAGTGAQGILVDVAAVRGGDTGILMINEGSGQTRVSATGRVTGATGSGILVDNHATATDIRVDAVEVTGGLFGVLAFQDGVGETFISTTGLVTGGNFGILAQNGVTSTDLTIHATDVQSAGGGIVAENKGSGDTSIFATGSVVGQSKWGLRAFADITAGDIKVEAGNASGALSGISTVNLGQGDTRVTVNGIVRGGIQGIEASSATGQNVIIINNGIVSNTSGLGSDRAITATGVVGIGNAGSLIGTLEISGINSLTLNTGTWRSIGGTSHFGTTDDQLFNGATGTIFGGLSAATAETTIWQGLERFQNAGVLRLQDGGTGDLIQTSAATTFANGSGLTVDIGGATGSDLYRTSGTVQIEAGSRLQSVTGQPLVLYGKHVVVQADGGLTGQFIYDDKLLTAFAGLRDGYTANTAYIEFAQLKPLAVAGLTPNQKAAAGGADSLPNGNPVKDALLLLPTDAAAQAAFDQLSGEIHPSARGASVEESRLIRGAVLDRLTDAEPGWALWGRIFGTSGFSDGDYNAAEVNRDTRGGVMGLDRSFGPVTLGIAGGWSKTDLHVARRDSSGSTDAVHGMVYAGGRFGRFGLRAGVGYARTSTETVRHIAFPGFSGSPTASYDGSLVHGFVEGGYRVPLGGGSVEPFASITAIRVKTDAFTEIGGPAALSGAAISEDTTSSMLGARFQTSQAGPFSVRGTVGWRHAWGDLEPVGRHAFAGGTPFTIVGATGSQDAGVFNAEAQFRLSTNVMLSVGYDGVLGTGGFDHAITGGLSIVF